MGIWSGETLTRDAGSNVPTQRRSVIFASDSVGATSGEIMWQMFQERGIACVEPEGMTRTHPRPLAVLPGSFNPLHHGHTGLAAVAATRLGVEVHFELSVQNADKPELAPEEVERRVTQFAGVGPVWVTRAAAFEKKADLFPGAAFVLGWDTAIRLIDPKYYGGEPGRDAALRKLLARECRLVIGGRRDAQEVFRVWETPEELTAFAELFVPLTEADFRADVSSTELRRG